ncbi:hypothetical protein DRO61_12415 [Candidatus Bathyarchaeota archaeon]|nr:MAG: hypothetical protein DRO61_12415 [Candidatus Bathyarchaeota archaeon]
MTSNEKLLNQLNGKELRQLADAKRYKVPSSWKKHELVEFLCLNLTKEETKSLVQEASRTKKEQALKDKTQDKERSLEETVLEIFTKQGYICTMKRHVSSGEFEVTGEKKRRWFSKKSYLFAEYKHQEEVRLADFEQFLINFSSFKQQKKIPDDDISGWLYTQGLYALEVRKRAHQLSNVKLRRIRML